MPSYVPRTTPVRKQEILEKREAELCHALRQALSPDRINRLSEKVREAQLNLIKAKKHLDQSFKAEDRTVEQEQRLENLNKQTELWLKYTSQEIIELYRKKNTEPVT
jgi:hypothetical protein